MYLYGYSMKTFPLSLLASSMIFSSYTYAQSDAKPAIELEGMTIKATKEAERYVAITPNSLKDDAPLYETAQSISVLTPQQVEQKQASTIAELLENVAGVSSGVQGRRGWDDFIIRGQVSSAQTYVDGMRVQTSTNNLRAWDVGTADSIEVVKGVTTTGYGMNLPGGIVNITSKRPASESFNNIKLTGGNFDQKEISYDINYTPTDGSQKGAFRLNGRYADRDDATDHVYFKNYYVAPSYTFNTGENTNFTLLGSYQWREYIRQQGLPHNNTIDLSTGIKTLRNAHQAYPTSTYFGLPNYGYEQKTWRAGYDLTHYFGNDWKAKSIFAVTKTDTDGNPVLATAYSNFYKDGKIGRQINNQTKKDLMYTMDNRLEKLFLTGGLEHNVVVGMDLLHEKSDYYRRNDRANPDFNISTPNYAVTNITDGTPAHNITRTQYAGLYIQDTLRFNNWLFGLSARHDWASSKITDVRTDTITKNSDNAITGNVSAMYDLNGKFAPYVSFGTTFMQNNDIDVNGKSLDPETGKQAEIGIKFQGFDKRLQGYLSTYDLTRKNVAETVYDTSGIASNYSELVGEQRTKGVELEAALALDNQWNISGSYSYIPTAEIVDNSRATSIGQRISQIPKHAASISTQYYFNPNRLGFYLGGSLRHQGNRTAWRTQINNRGAETTHAIDLPAYTLLDLKAGYEAQRWGFDLAIKNVLDKDYLIGTTPNAQLVSYGEPRNIRATLNFKF